MAAEPEPPWRPGAAICDTTELAHVLEAIGFGQGDGAYNLIAQKLCDRGCKHVADLRDNWTRQELISTIRPLGAKRAPISYVEAILTGLGGMELEGERELAIKKEERKYTGGDMTERSKKVRPSKGFNPFMYDPDGALYKFMPGKGSVKHMGSEEEKLCMDLIWLYANADVEPSMGAYLPEGMPFRLAQLHTQRLPPFAPKILRGIMATEVPLTLEEIKKKYKDRFQNGRNTPYKRMVLDADLADYFTPQVAKHLRFVPAGDDALIDNIRNRAMATFVGIFAGTIPRMVVKPGAKQVPPPVKKGFPAAPGLTGGLGKSATPAADGDSSEDEPTLNDLAANTLAAAAATTAAAAAAAADDDADDIDGLLLNGSSTALPPAPLRSKQQGPSGRRAAAGSSSTLSKKQQQSEKRKAGLGKGGGKGAHLCTRRRKKPKTNLHPHDGSEESSEDGDSPEGGDSSEEDEGLEPARPPLATKTTGSAGRGALPLQAAPAPSTLHTPHGYSCPSPVS